jgi:hypothetical protein
MCGWGAGMFSHFGVLIKVYIQKPNADQEEPCHPQLLFGKRHAISLGIDLQLEQTQFLRNSEQGQFISYHKAQVSNKYVCFILSHPLLSRFQ